MFFKNRNKKNFYKKEIENIQRRIWRQELRVITVKEIREGIRMVFDKCTGKAKALEIEIKIVCEKGNIPLKSLEVLNIDIKKGENQSMDDWYNTINQRRVDAWSKEMKRLIELSPNVKEDRKKLKNIGKEVLKLYTTKAVNEIDAKQMQIQMMGNYNEEAKRYIGGLDGEIKGLKKNIQGGIEFRKIIERELKKL